MAWADVQARLKFWGSRDEGLDGTDDTVNDVRAASVETAFKTQDKTDLLSAILTTAGDR